ncbi:EAL domain-containing protein [Frankia sp. CNm7]|uniref:EAL domain-containing protein n=2 Tax=Frankia nepalensis TaxID=1836974 RepID=A0A937RHX1_9ACTN|nr:EAL domain-containing protein [Frankia nepalensis]MBL7513451.1 EAL domain-containing protein [Frankia nepalensis]MBL7520840.1 EAL domain-containing protein [Frankia nepalensis]MBL7632553.1 EAL domain-containing protein [Frankia nepalensis]
MTGLVGHVHLQEGVDEVAIFGPTADVLNEDRKVTELLDVLRRHLGMDIAALSMLDDDGLLVVQVVSGDATGFGIAPGMTLLRGKELHERHWMGDLPAVCPDTSRDSRIVAPLASALHVGAFATTCVVDAAGEPYGLLACCAHEPRPALRDRDAQFLVMMAEFLRTSMVGLQRMWEARSRTWRTVCDVVDAGGPRIVYQPIVRFETGAVAGVEALSRFPDRGEGDGGPLGWFADAKVIGLGPELEMTAIHQALSALASLPPGVKMAVNASPGTVTAGLVHLCALKEKDRQRLIVEITEHEDCASYPEAMRAVRRLRAHNIHVAIDDAGIGYSGLAQLLRLRPDIIKIDGMITRGIDQDPACRAVAAGLVQLAREIDGTVIAEGIETIADRDAVVAAGIPYGQGHLLGRPAPTVEAACTARTTLDGA